MKHKLLILLCMGSLLLGSCINNLDNIDNYNEPDGGIYGAILDSATLENIPMPAESPTSTTRLHIFEYNSPADPGIPIWARMDGSFKNEFIFNGKYKIALENYAIFPMDTLIADVNGLTKFDIKAVPYASIKASAVIVDSTYFKRINNVRVEVTEKFLKVKYKISRSRNNYKIQSVALFWHVSPYIDNQSYNLLASKLYSYTKVDDAKILNANLSKEVLLTEFTSYVSGKDTLDYLQTKKDIILKNNNITYLRVGVKSNEKYNYSEVIPLEIKY